MKLKCLWPLALLCLAGCVTARHAVNTPPPGPTLAEVQALVQAHVSDDVIVNQIQNSSTRYPLTADQIIALHNAGVGAPILNALINSVNKVPAATATADTYVYSYAYVDPWPWPWFWWGCDPGYYGGYYHGYYHGNGYYHGGYYGGYNHGGPPHAVAPHGGQPSSGSPHGNPAPGGGPHGGGYRH